MGSLMLEYYNNLHKRRIIENAINNTFLYNLKVLNLGKYFRVIKNKKGYFSNYQMIRKNVNDDKYRGKLNEERFLSSIYRTRQRLRDICLTNFTGNDSFLTMTFAENVTSLKEANEKFDLFRRKLKRYLKKLNYELKYVSVIEFQKRGAVHYHIILFDVPKIDYKKIYDMWSQGWVYIKKIKNERMMINYVSKYIIKNINSEGMIKLKKNEKFYDRSRNLKDVEVIKVNDGIDIDIIDLFKDDSDIIYCIDDEEKTIIFATNLNLNKINEVTDKYKKERRSKYRLIYEFDEVF